MPIFDSPIIVGAYLFSVCLAVLLIFIERLLTSSATKRKNKIVKETYPDLSKKDLAFRRANLLSYYRIYSASSLNSKIIVALYLVLFLVFGITCVIAFTPSTSGFYFRIGLVLFLMAIITLILPDRRKSQTFWENYLQEHPDNPLMVIIFPTKNDRNILVFAKISAVFRLFCSFFSFYLAYCLFQFNL
ncbi:hypothetical protein JZO76_04050 [Enterococcus sp. MJM12]|uniref:Integral membrane protein n=1 Tax=Candidatus Enterococcus myersii TaxID=2815322 RepID=A0ABS3H5G5_9ENTE|nr:hypothetical protein [Enterococcus sp. MJM12]MBO0448702.1 hypothetical protein [Enterococcus sp. MJM12]